MTYNPMMKKWGLYFNRANGYDNRTAIVKEHDIQYFVVA